MLKESQRLIDCSVQCAVHATPSTSLLRLQPRGCRVLKGRHRRGGPRGLRSCQAARMMGSTWSMGPLLLVLLLRLALLVLLLL